MIIKPNTTNAETNSNALARTSGPLMQQRRSNEKAMQGLIEDQMAVVTEREHTCSLLDQRIMVATKDIALRTNVQAEKKRVLEATIKAQEEEFVLLRVRTTQLQKELAEVPLHYQTYDSAGIDCYWHEHRRGVVG
jgi:hypothetical protein